MTSTAAHIIVVTCVSMALAFVQCLMLYIGNVTPVDGMVFQLKLWTVLSGTQIIFLIAIQRIKTNSDGK